MKYRNFIAASYYTMLPILDDDEKSLFLQPMKDIVMVLCSMKVIVIKLGYDLGSLILWVCIKRKRFIYPEIKNFKEMFHFPNVLIWFHFHVNFKVSISNCFNKFKVFHKICFIFQMFLVMKNFYWKKILWNT